MPAYNAQVPPFSVSPGDSITLAVPGDNVAAGFTSQQVAIARPYGASGPWAGMAEVTFSAAPGAFEVDLQEALTDAAASYQIIGGTAKITALVGASLVATFDVQGTSPFFRFAVPTLTNAVSVTLRFRLNG